MTLLGLRHDHCASGHLDTWQLLVFITPKMSVVGKAVLFAYGHLVANCGLVLKRCGRKEQIGMISSKGRLINMYGLIMDPHLYRAR